MSLSLSMRHTHRIKLEASQKAQLQLLLSHTLEKPESQHYALQGFDGMLAAHNILVKHRAVGVLIGGLAPRVWNRRRTEKELAQHKDVDVVVLPTHGDDEPFRPSDPFEGGIDWWFPQTERLTIRDRSLGSTERFVTWFTNGNMVKLNFGLRSYGEFPEFGLHVMDADTVVEMQVAEKVADFNAEFDDDVREVYKRQLEKKVATCLPKFIVESPIHSESSDIGLDEFDHDVVRTLRNV